LKLTEKRIPNNDTAFHERPLILVRQANTSLTYAEDGRLS